MTNQLASDDGAFIPKATAKMYCKNYRLVNTSGTTLSHFFGKNKLLEVLNQENVIGLRLYYGYARAEDDSLVPEIVIVGVNDEKIDILDTNKILEFSRPCPPFCQAEGSETL